jgi:hypothetical protein
MKDIIVLILFIFAMVIMQTLFGIVVLFISWIFETAFNNLFVKK